MPAILIDTNILVYAYDRGEHVKQQQAIRILESLQSTDSGRLSVQSLSEFFNAVTKGKSPILTIEEAKQQTEELARTWRVLNLTARIVLEAARGVRDYQLSFWDAQIWATARLNQIPIVLSEDLQSAEIVEGVRFVNPFVSTFDAQSLVG